MPTSPPSQDVAVGFPLSFFDEIILKRSFSQERTVLRCIPSLSDVSPLPLETARMPFNRRRRRLFPQSKLQASFGLRISKSALLLPLGKEGAPASFSNRLVAASPARPPASFSLVRSSRHSPWRLCSVFFPSSGSRRCVLPLPPRQIFFPRVRSGFPSSCLSI